MSRSGMTSCSLLSAFWFVVAASTSVGQPSFRELSSPESLLPKTNVAAMSGDGRILAGRGDRFAIIWTNDGAIANKVIIPGKTAYLALGISSNGRWVVGSLNPTGFRHDVLTGATIEIPDLAGDPVGGTLYSVSNDGLHAGGNGLGPGGVAPILWTQAGGTVALAAPGFLPSRFPIPNARAMNPDGSIIVGSYLTSSASRAFLWRPDTGRVDLPDPAGSSWEPIQVSDDGSVVAGAKFPPAPTPVGLRWTAAEGFLELGILSNGLPAGYPYAMTPDGRVIAGGQTAESYSSPTSPSVSNAYFWTKRRGPVLLQPYLLKLGLPVSGWKLTSVMGISDDGMVLCGNGINPSGEPRAWRAELPYSLLGEACPCIADFDESGGMPSNEDLEAYFQAWLAGNEDTDTDCSGGTPEFPDLHQFLIQWLTGGC